MNAFRISTIVLSLAAFGGAPGLAQCEFDRIVSGWGSTWGLFGDSVAIEGNTAVIGASGEDSNGDYKGAVYVFEYTDQWIQVARLTASDRAQNDSFGGAVAISGDWVLAGATGDNSYQGAAYFFKKPDNGWTDMTETQKVTAPDGSPGDFFGRDVDIDGEVAAIGADQHGDPWEMMGAVYVYRYDGESWGSVKKLLANDSDNDYAQDHFGFSVALSGDTLVVGAPSDDYGSYDRCGAAYIFCYEFDGDYWTWVQKAKLRAEWPGSNDSLGHDVAIDGDTVLVGAPDDGASGAAHVFEKPPNGWTDMNETQRLSVPGDQNAERLGMSVAIDGDTLIVGDNYAEDFGTLGGAAHTFQYDGSSWGGPVKVLASDGSQGQEFGNSVALDGDTIVIGAYGDNWNGTYTGAVYLFAVEGDDCNFNGVCDLRDIAQGFSEDCNGNGKPDECESARWTGEVDEYFSTPGNWECDIGGPPVVPTGNALIEYIDAPASLTKLANQQQRELCTLTLRGTDTETQTFQIATDAMLTMLSDATIEVGGLLELDGGTVDAGSLTVKADGKLGGDGDIQGSELIVESGGELFVESDGKIDGLSTSPTLQGQTTINADATLDFVNQFDNQGRIDLLAGGWLEGPSITNSAGLPDNGLYLEDASVKAVNSSFDNFGYILSESGANTQSDFHTDLTNKSGGIFFVNETCTRVHGDVTNNGTVYIADDATLRVDSFSGDAHTGPGDLERGNPQGTGTLRVDEDLSLEASATLLLPRGLVRVDGSVELAINDPERFDLGEGTLQLNGVYFLGEQYVEMMAADAGDVVNPDDPALFKIGELHVGPNQALVSFVDNYDNSGTGGAETLYVRRLILEDNTTVDLNSANLYYQEMTVGTDVTIENGEPTPIDCNDNGVPDYQDLAECDGSPWCEDCNGNGILDACDIAYGNSEDANNNGIPDECEGGLGDSDPDGPVAPTFARPVRGWRESFDAYENGSGMHGQNDWQGWDNDPAFDAFVTDAQARSIPHSVDVAEASDLVHPYDGYTSGQWRFTAWQYIPADFTCDNDTPFEPGTYFLLLNTYNDGGPYNWSVQFVFDSNDGMLKVSYGDGHGTIDVPYVTDQWVKIHAEIDLDGDLTRVYYHGELIAEYSWTGGIYGEGGGALDIGAVDLFANGSSSVYYDDLSLRPVRSPQ